MLWLIQGLCHPCGGFVVQEFSNAHHSTRQRVPIRQLHASIVNRPQDETQQQSSSSSSEDDIVISTDFWGSTIRHGKSEGESTDLPCVPNLDSSGPLPQGAYYHNTKNQQNVAYSSSYSSSPPLCRISVALDVQNSGTVQDDDNPWEAMMDQVHSMMDDGFASFQVLHTDGEQQQEQQSPDALFYRTLFQNTPGSVLRNAVHMTLPWTIPHDTSSSAAVHPRAIRASIKESLGRYFGGKEDVLPTIQLVRPIVAAPKKRQQQPQSSSRSSSTSFIRQNNHPQPTDLPLHLDVLDALQDLQRDGLIADVSAREWTSSMLRSSHACGYALSQHQVDMNLLNMESSYNFDNFLTARDLKIPLQATAPLLGGLLSEQFCNRPLVPMSRELTSSAQEYLASNLVQWHHARHPSKSHHEDDNEKDDWIHGDTIRAWRSFSHKCLPELEHLGRKHGVPSLSTVALRWLLQLDQVESVVVRTRASYNDDHQSCRWRDWRNVFRMELDDTEMEELWDWTTYRGIPDLVHGDPAFLGSQEDDDFLDSLEQSSGGLFLPSSNNGPSSKTLWL